MSTFSPILAFVHVPKFTDTAEEESRTIIFPLLVDVTSYVVSEEFEIFCRGAELTQFPLTPSNLSVWFGSRLSITTPISSESSKKIGSSIVT
jgi:hypothetical protein